MKIRKEALVEKIITSILPEEVKEHGYKETIEMIKNKYGFYEKEELKNNELIEYANSICLERKYNGLKLEGPVAYKCIYIKDKKLENGVIKITPYMLRNIEFEEKEYDLGSIKLKRRRVVKSGTDLNNTDIIDLEKISFSKYRFSSYIINYHGMYYIQPNKFLHIRVYDRKNENCVIKISSRDVDISDKMFSTESLIIKLKEYVNTYREKFKDCELEIKSDLDKELELKVLEELM